MRRHISDLTKPRCYGCGRGPCHLYHADTFGTVAHKCSGFSSLTLFLQVLALQMPLRRKIAALGILLVGCLLVYLSLKGDTRLLISE